MKMCKKMTILQVKTPTPKSNVSPSKTRGTLFSAFGSRSCYTKQWRNMPCKGMDQRIKRSVSPRDIVGFRHPKLFHREF